MRPDYSTLWPSSSSERQLRTPLWDYERGLLEPGCEFGPWRRRQTNNFIHLTKPHFLTLYKCTSAHTRPIKYEWNIWNVTSLVPTGIRESKRGRNFERNRKQMSNQFTSERKRPSEWPRTAKLILLLPFSPSLTHTNSTALIFSLTSRSPISALSFLCFLFYWLDYIVSVFGLGFLADRGSRPKTLTVTLINHSLFLLDEELCCTNRHICGDVDLWAKKRMSVFVSTCIFSNWAVEKTLCESLLT